MTEPIQRADQLVVPIAPNPGELDPPGGAVRWGRRVCAAAVRRGILLRPLGDVVVIMPPLTSTADELDRVVDVLAACIDEVWAEDAG